MTQEHRAMRFKRVKTDIRAIQLNRENFPIVEQLCNGSIRGIKLPINDRVVQFHDGEREHELCMTDWLVQFHVRDADRTIISQVWSDKAFRAVFQDIDPTPY